MWTTSLRTLSQLTGITDIQNQLEFQPRINFASVLLASRDLWRKLPRHLKARVLLWHSTMVHLILTTRNEAISFIDPERAKNQDGRQIRRRGNRLLQFPMTQIYQEHKSKGHMSNFTKNWARNNQLISVDTSDNMISIILNGQNTTDKTNLPRPKDAKAKSHRTRKHGDRWKSGERLWGEMRCGGAVWREGGDIRLFVHQT